MRSWLITKKTTYIYLAVFFVCCFSFYWATNVMPISPIYFTTLFSFILFFFAIYYHKIPDLQIFIYLWHFLFAILYIFNCLFLNGRLHDSLVSCFFALTYIYSDIVLYQIKEEKQLKRLVKRYYYLFLIYYIIDLFLRYKYSITAAVPDWIKANPFYSFYLYKKGGLNGDANTIGNFCCVFFAFIYFCRKEKIVPRKFVILAFLLTFFSFSRAAIFSCIVLIIFDKFYVNGNAYAKFFFIILGIIIIVCFSSIFMTDPSFKIHFDIYIETFNYLKKCSLFEFLFGLGPNNSISVLGRYAHNIICIMLIEYGFIHFIIFIIMMFITYIDVGKNAKYIYITYFLTALSYTTIFIQFLFVALALTKHISKKLENDGRVNKNLYFDVGTKKEIK